MNADKPVGEGESAGASSADFAAVDAIGDECVPLLATFSALFIYFCASLLAVISSIRVAKDAGALIRMLACGGVDSSGWNVKQLYGR